MQIDWRIVTKWEGMKGLRLRVKVRLGVKEKLMDTDYDRWNIHLTKSRPISDFSAL